MSSYFFDGASARLPTRYKGENAMADLSYEEQIAENARLTREQWVAADAGIAVDSKDFPTVDTAIDESAPVE